MRVLLVHNRYREAGGEDAVVTAEAELLAGRGHSVAWFERDNTQLRPGPGAAVDTVWARGVARDFRRVLTQFQPDVVHVHNTFPAISPAVHWSAARVGVPLVQTLHNYRLLCVQAMLMRDGGVCEACVGKGPWRGVLHRCYRGSLAASAAAAASLAVHRRLGTWQHKVARYIALTDFAARKFIAAGLPAQRMTVKPNFVDLPALPEASRAGLLYVGRLAPEKGLALLARAAAGAGVVVDVVGTGPMAVELAGAPGLRLHGALAPEQVYARMRAAAALVMPSLWYEGFPRTLVEAYACGLPVIASRLGAFVELVQEGHTGWLVEPGSPDALAGALRRALARPEALAAMGVAARARYAADYGPDTNYRALIAIYEAARAA